MKERFYAPDKTAELLDRLIKEQYEAGEAEVANDLSQLRGIILPHSMADRRNTEAWMKMVHEKMEGKDNVSFPEKTLPVDNLVVREGQDYFNKKAKEFAAVSDKEIEAFLKDKFNTTDVSDFVSTAIQPFTKEQLGQLTETIKEGHDQRFDVSGIPGGIYSAPVLYGLPSLVQSPIEGAQQFTELCMKCHGIGLLEDPALNGKGLKTCDRCNGTGRVR